MNHVPATFVESKLDREPIQVNHWLHNVKTMRRFIAYILTCRVRFLLFQWQSWKNNKLFPLPLVQVMLRRLDRKKRAFCIKDDIFIYENSLHDHTLKLRKLVGWLKTFDLVLEPEKFQFLLQKVTYLGHIIQHVIQLSKISKWTLQDLCQERNLNKYILTAYDNLTEYSYVIPLAAAVSATVAVEFAKNLICRFCCL